jgi:predicted double-glycine peptidase
VNPNRFKALRDALTAEATHAESLVSIDNGEQLQVEGSIVRRIIDFPEARQATSFTCGAAAVQAVLYYYGDEWREDQLRQALGIQPDGLGVEPDVIEAFLRRKGYNVESGEMTIEELRGYVDRNVPVIVVMQAWNEAYRQRDVDYSGYVDGHYIVTIGYTDDAIIFEDPSIMSNRGYLLDEELDARWHDETETGERMNRYGIAVFGQSAFDRRRVLKIR